MLQMMRFVETSIFTKEVRDLLADDEYRALLQVAAENPKAVAEALG